MTTNPVFSTGFSTGVEIFGKRPIPSGRPSAQPSMWVRSFSNPRGLGGDRDFSTTQRRGDCRLFSGERSLTHNRVAISIVGSVIALFHLFLRNFDETYVPTESAPTPPHAWVPGAHANQERPHRPQAPPRQGPQAPDGLFRALAKARTEGTVPLSGSLDGQQRSIAPTENPSSNATKSPRYIVPPNCRTKASPDTSCRSSCAHNQKSSA